MLRNSRPFSTSAVRRPDPAEGPCPPVLTVAMNAKAAMAVTSVFKFMARDSVRIRVRGQLTVSTLSKRFLVATSFVVIFAAFPASCAHHAAPTTQPSPPPAATAPPPAQPAAPAAVPASETTPARLTLPDRLSDADFW